MRRVYDGRRRDRNVKSGPTSFSGTKRVCGPDGQWFRDYSALIVRNAVYEVVGTATIRP